MKFLSVVTPPSIYHDFSTWEIYWEDNFTSVNMRNYGHHNVIKHKEIKNNEQYISLGIYLKLYWLDKRKLTSSGSRDYVGISVKGINTSLNLRTRRSSTKKKNTRTDITDIVTQYFVKLLDEFKYVPYFCYSKKHIKI